ncbi:MAG: nitrilase-related carbon-nitrogen hydrolase [Bacteroidota bacterium]
MRIAIVQTSPAFGKVDSNVKEAISMMSVEQADLFVLPELFNTGYNFIDEKEVSSLAEPVDGATYQAISSYSHEHDCYIAYGIAEKADRLYNSAILTGPDGLVGLYRKVHLFYRETLYFAPGNLGFPVFDLPIGKIGIMICFDWIYPEAARTLALKGAQLLVHPSNLVMPHCPDAMVTRCLENRVFAATSNRIGTEDRGGEKLTYIGSSEIVSPKGKILARMKNTETGVVVVDIDLKEADNKKINPYNDLMDGRRKDHYLL